VDKHRRIIFGRVFHLHKLATVKARSPSEERHVASTFKSAEDQYTVVLDALRDPQVCKQCRDVVVALRPDYETCSGVDDGLQSVQLVVWQSGECDFAVI